MDDRIHAPADLAGGAERILAAGVIFLSTWAASLPIVIYSAVRSFVPERLSLP
ncbi:hypothetical protein [Paraburkholderia unamae]|uniref:hypothetical protein n=1 Tax=Paraburkholderia unamae TaxID=219649 RepID=UPI001401F05A|nr:hypothetical protein [Paraburkholderia unamae]